MYSAHGPCLESWEVISLCQKCALFLWQVIESGDVNRESDTVKVWLSPQRQCLSEAQERSIVPTGGHKKGINLNLVYNAMPFKLIHLACALELPATPSIPHSVCQRSLCAEGVNVNSSSAWTEKSLKDTEREGENEDRKKIDGIYGDFSL